MQRKLTLFAAMVLSATAFAQSPPDPQSLADRIDHHIAARWKAEKIEPAPSADDAEFLRRASLDITGRIPKPRDVYEFLADTDPHKRQKLIDDLLDGPRYAVHFANVWRALLLPEAAASAEARFFQPGFEAWLRDRLRQRVGYDQMVRELLTVPISSDGGDAQAVFRRPDQANPLAFFAVKEAKPENLAAATTRLFLGIQIECAQCHDHPFARWSRDQFWNQAAFFAGLERQGEGLFAPLTEVVDRRTVIQPNSKRKVAAAFLDDVKPKWKANTSPRTALAEWMTAGDNPYFAKAAVNRVWGHFFGVGLVEPVDDFNDKNEPSHPELLDELARAFVDSKFDLTYLIRAIARSKTYQLSSARTDKSQDTPRTFARMSVKGLTGEQLFDSLALATGFREASGDRGPFERDGNSPRRQFLVQFAPQGRPSEPETSILQALTLMNGKFLADATNVSRSETLIAVIGMPGLTTAERIDALYVATLSRKTNVQEMQKLLQFVAKGDEPKRLADICWVLLNSAEFRLNH